mmetsp:Transcript_4869/g.11926  ORF Transcript_4869/g.11926 Transcript_4869/m.11926 type:complete len:383 (+) Transcript_4869:229-1377(+)
MIPVNANFLGECQGIVAVRLLDVESNDARPVVLANDRDVKEAIADAHAASRAAVSWEEQAQRLAVAQREDLYSRLVRLDHVQTRRIQRHERRTLHEARRLGARAAHVPLELAVELEERDAAVASVRHREEAAARRDPLGAEELAVGRARLPLERRADHHPDELEVERVERHHARVGRVDDVQTRRRNFAADAARVDEREAARLADGERQEGAVLVQRRRVGGDRLLATLAVAEGAGVVEVHLDHLLLRLVAQEARATVARRGGRLLEGLRHRLLVARGERVEGADDAAVFAEELHLVHSTVANTQAEAGRHQAQVRGTSKVLLLARVFRRPVRHLLGSVQHLVGRERRGPQHHRVPVASRRAPPLPHVVQPAASFLERRLQR